MENCKVSVEGDELVVRIKHAIRGAKSASGKSTLVASTRGNTEVETPSGTLSLGVNCFVK